MYDILYIEDVYTHAQKFWEEYKKVQWDQETKRKGNCIFCFYNFLNCVNFHHIYGLLLFLIVNNVLSAYLDSGFFNVFLCTNIYILKHKKHYLRKMQFEKTLIFLFIPFIIQEYFKHFQYDCIYLKIKYTHIYQYIYKSTYITSVQKHWLPLPSLGREPQTTRI